MLDKEKVKELYLKGYNATQIADIINAKTEAVRKCIQRNTNMKENKKHNEAVRTRRDWEKAINYESSKYISDRSFILKNRSAYETKVNGDIVMKKEIKNIAPGDMPRRLTNEFKAENMHCCVYELVEYYVDNGEIKPFIIDTRSTLEEIESVKEEVACDFKKAGIKSYEIIMTKDINSIKKLLEDDGIKIFRIIKKEYKIPAKPIKAVIGS